MDFRHNIIKAWMEKSKKHYEMRDGLGGEFQFAEILINCWISFEAYTCIKYNLEQVRGRINAFCRDHEIRYTDNFDKLPDDLRENVTRLSKYSIQDMRPNHQSDQPKQIIDVKDLSSVMGVIYQIRNNLFHGGKDVQNINDKNVIEYSAITLYRLLEWVLHSEHYI